MAAALGAEIFSRGFRFNPTPLEAATYYIPRLAAGAPLHDAVRPVVHRADVYASEPGELAPRFRPMPKTGDRFFFSSCAKKGARAAGPGSWYLQSTKAVNDGAAKVGEIKKFRYKKGGVFTDWLMDEFSSTLCSEQAVAGGGGGLFVFCKIYVSPRAAPDSATRQESAAFFAPPAAPPPPAVAVTQVAAAFKRPAPESAEPHCPKRMRVAAAPIPPVVQPAGHRTAFFAPPPPPPAPTRVAAPPPSRPPATAPPQTLVQFTKQLMPPPTLPVVRACHVPAVQAPAPHCRPEAPSEKTKQRTRDPFEAAEVRYEAEDERVASPDPKESPAALGEDDNLDELIKAMEDDLPTGEGSIVTDDEMGQHIASLFEDEVIEFNYD